MPLKPNGALCHVREQIIVDPASGLTLQFECNDGRLRLVIAGKPLALGNARFFSTSKAARPRPERCSASFAGRAG